MYFAEQLRILRLSRRLSQSELARLTEFDHSYVSRLEGGARQPTRATVSKFVVVLQLDAETGAKLYASAGYLPLEVYSLLDDEPIVRDLFKMLIDQKTPTTKRVIIRDCLRTVLRMAEL